MVQKFSKEFLFSIRNYIPITEVIEKTLDIPCKRSEGQFRFLCPICQEFRGAVNERTNLARCFRCEENFNSIDLTMIVKQVKFVNAIEILSTQLAMYHQNQLAK